MGNGPSTLEFLIVATQAMLQILAKRHF